MAQSHQVDAVVLTKSEYGRFLRNTSELIIRYPISIQTGYTTRYYKPMQELAKSLLENIIIYATNKQQKNSVALSPRANYTD
jgi:ATP-dependent protease ClpP protease subunit